MPGIRMKIKGKKEGECGNATKKAKNRMENAETEGVWQGFLEQYPRETMDIRFMGWGTNTVGKTEKLLKQI